MYLLAPANCSGETDMSSLTISDCRNSQVLHTMVEHSDNSCFAPEMTARMNQTTTMGLDMDSKSSGSHVTMQIITIISVAVVTCVFCSLLFLAIGYLCCRHFSVKKHPVAVPQSPIYEEVFSHEHSKEVELKENEAYGPLQN